MLTVAKLPYSRNPWRIVHQPCPAGDQHRTAGRCLACEVYAPEDIDHWALGRITVAGPLCFPRKRDALAFLAARDDSLRVIAQQASP